MHGFTSFALILTLAWLMVKPLHDAIVQHPEITGALIACVEIAIGAWWEVIEALLDAIGLLIVDPYADTIADLVMDTLGAILAATLAVWSARRATESRQHSGAMSEKRL